MTSALVQTIDHALMGLCGLGYFRITRDSTIAERAQYFAHYVRTAPQPQVSILDVGCGSGAPLMWLEQMPDKVGSYLGIDRDVMGQERRFENSTIPHAFRTVDLDASWDFGRFDLVACLEVMEHLVDDRSLFAKLCSQVAPHGRLLISTPSSPFVARMGKVIPGFDRVSPTQDGDHVRMGYTIDEFRAMADANGMEILSVDWLSRFDTEELRCSFNMLGITRRLWHNWRYPRDNANDAWVIGGDPAICADTYWSIGVYMRKKTVNGAQAPEG
ncbi:MAG: class I SAM-dependent methyltransferase [Alphaproteobacteria bacterium]|nr:class I SAM-dependent methyltransferase [Alphaproteobacteria bacterium]